MTAYPPVERVCVVLPTYNEIDNVEAMVRQILAVFEPSEATDIKLLVVDDESPDGTGEKVAELAQDDARIELLSGEKKGLGSAYSRGFQRVLEDEKFDAVVQMDADFSSSSTR